LTPAQLAAVISHELCHIRRRDNLTAVLHMTVETIFWFHPLVWWIGARLVDERERACDEHVLRTIDAPHVYAEGILGVCKRYLDSPIACASGVSGGALRKRLEAIVVNRVGRQLSLTRRVVLTAAAAAALVLPLVAGMAPASLQATSQEQARKFDVASVKPCEQQPVPPGGRSGGGNGSFSPGRAHLNCFVVRNLIDQAYVHNRVNDPDDPLYAWTGLEGILGARPDGTGAQRIRGGPSWVYSDKYTIEATASGLDPSQPRNADRGVMLGPMLRALLEDRFKLKVHQDVEEVPMWALTVAKGGLKVKPITDEGCVTLDPAKDRMPTMDEEIAIMRGGGKPVCGHGVIGGKNGPNEALALGRQTMKGVARMLSVHTDRMILDKTGVEGRFNLYLEFAADDRFRDPLFFKPRGAEAAGPPTAPNVFTALQEQWGLKLEPAKGPRGFIVIDRIERPAPDTPSPGLGGIRH
jgi:uncharacterized protein (TIGR03435 family)